MLAVSLLRAGTLYCGDDVVNTKECGDLYFSYFKNSVTCQNCGHRSDDDSLSKFPLCPLKDPVVAGRLAGANWKTTFTDNPLVEAKASINAGDKMYAQKNLGVFGGKCRDHARPYDNKIAQLHE